MSQVQKSLSECSSAFFRSASRRASLTGRERPFPSVSNLRVFDNVQILEKIEDQVQITLNRTGDQIGGRVHSPSSGGNSRGDPAVSAKPRFREHSCANRRRPNASNSYSSRAVHRTLKLVILWWSHSQQNLLYSETPLQGRAVPRNLKPVTPSLAFLTYSRRSGCRDNVENQWARRAELI